MGIRKQLFVILFILIGSFMIFENELKVIDNKVIFKANWGKDENQLYYEENKMGGADWIPDSFLVLNNQIVIRQQTYKSNEFMYFNIKDSSLNIVERFDSFKKKFDKNNFILSPGIPKKEGSNSIISLLGVYEKNSYNTFKLLLICIDLEDNEILVLNENLQKKEFKDNSFFNVTSDGGTYINQEGDLSYYDKKGKFVGELKNPKIMYTDKHGYIYIREADNKVGLYNIQNKRIAYFEVPPEIGGSFKIDGGDVESYLYQWKLDKEESRSKGEYKIMIDLYKLEPDKKSDKWYMWYKGFVTLGVCHPKGQSKLFKNTVYDRFNIIDAEKGLLQIDPDGTIYHDERDDREFRIIKKKVETVK
jgi:hypothetical protein